MELQLDELIQSIKKDGLEAAEQQKKDIIAEAESEARRIIERAQKEADEKTAAAEAKIRKFEESGKASLQQAGRDLILNLKKKIEEIFSRILISAVDENLTAETVGALIPSVIAASGENPDRLKAVVSGKDAEAVTAFLKKSLAKEISAGLEIAVSPGSPAGFRVEIKDGSAYYDFSDEKIAQMLSVYLNPKIAELLDA